MALVKLTISGTMPMYDYGDLTQANYWTLFGQINKGRKTKRSEYALGIRIAYSKYRNINFYNSHPNSNYIKSKYENLQGLSADPAISYSYLLKGFKFNAQAGLAIPIGLGSINRTDSHILNDGTTIIRSEEEVPLWTVLGRISLQYNLNLGQSK